MTTVSRFISCNCVTPPCNESKFREMNPNSVKRIQIPSNESRSPSPHSLLRRLSRAEVVAGQVARRVDRRPELAAVGAPEPVAAGVEAPSLKRSRWQVGQRQHRPARVGAIECGPTAWSKRRGLRYQQQPLPVRAEVGSQPPRTRFLDGE